MNQEIIKAVDNFNDILINKLEGHQHLKLEIYPFNYTRITFVWFDLEFEIWNTENDDRKGVDIEDWNVFFKRKIKEKQKLFNSLKL